MTKKLSIVRFKPKPEYFDEFLQNIQAWQSQVHADDDHLLMRTDEEVVAVVVRDSEMLQENIQLGVAWLDWFPQPCSDKIFQHSGIKLHTCKMQVSAPFF